MTTAAQALQRAKLRMLGHGWRQGPMVQKPKFLGYGLKDAVLGKDGGAGTAAEQDALVLIDQAIRLLFKDDYETFAGEDLLTAFNDAPRRSRGNVLDVIRRAQAVAKAHGGNNGRRAAS